jgi:hypothetical protein
MIEDRSADRIGTGNRSAGASELPGRRAVRGVLAGASAMALLVGAQFLVQVATTGPAAAMPGRQVVQASSPDGSPEVQSAMAMCPSGRRVLGGGARISGGHGYVILRGMWPGTYFGRDVYHAVGIEQAGGYGGSWRITAYAICGLPPDGYHVVQLSSDTATWFDNDTRFAYAPCSGQVIGTGFRLSRDEGRATPSAFFMPGPNSVYALAVADSPDTDDEFAISAYAICANPHPSWEKVWWYGSMEPTSVRYASVTCPVGKTVHAVGFTAGEGDAVLDDGRVHIDAVYPTGIGAETTVAVHAQSVAPPTASWRLGAFAVCIA